MMQDQAAQLRRMVSREGPDDGSATRARQIAFSGCRGGVGTSTIAIGLAIALSKLSHRVLLVDANPLRGDIATMCRLSGDQDISDVLSGRLGLKDVVVSGPAGIHVVPRLGLLDQHSNLVGRRLVRSLESVSQHYDHILLDCGSCPVTAEMLWTVADQACLVTTTDHVSLMNGYAMIKAIHQSAHIASLACIVNKFDNKQVAIDVSSRLKESCRRFLKLELECLGAIPRDRRMKDAEEQARAVLCATPHAASSIALGEICRRLDSVDVDSNDLNSAEKGRATEPNEKVNNFDSIGKPRLPIHS